MKHFRCSLEGKLKSYSNRLQLLSTSAEVLKQVWSKANTAYMTKRLELLDHYLNFSIDEATSANVDFTITFFSIANINSFIFNIRTEKTKKILTTHFNEIMKAIVDLSHSDVRTFFNSNYSSGLQKRLDFNIPKKIQKKGASSFLTVQQFLQALTLHRQGSFNDPNLHICRMLLQAVLSLRSINTYELNNNSELGPKLCKCGPGDTCNIITTTCAFPIKIIKTKTDIPHETFLLPEFTPCYFALRTRKVTASIQENQQSYSSFLKNHFNNCKPHDIRKFLPNVSIMAAGYKNYGNWKNVNTIRNHYLEPETHKLFTIANLTSQVSVSNNSHK